ncbi:complement C1q tumor necrosis factor-related protein 4-like [Alosa sapidissima]|uniref:complement C1q tumor necrosis factor-related protein 4-like n=1 Tax=Alosa sapidissima TaxID=34773 RepID=UPI001C096B1D|nr:complement C1q tumor necrosis factor-related protein 4-like [Alosa sapidissima]
MRTLTILLAFLYSCTAQLALLTEELITAKEEVAFTAALQPSSWDNSGFGKIGPFDTEITLEHGNVLTNVGRTYDSTTGVFTAPVKGVYFFTFTTYSWVAEADIGVKLMKNNEEVLLVWEWQDKGDNEDYASNSVLLKLEVGDKVYMRLPKGYQVAASKNSNIHTFSGFLLYPFHNSEDQSREVAFTAALQPSSPDDSGFGRIGPFGTEITLEYGKVLTNVGRAYDSNIGVFTAPVKGVYFFTFTTYSWVKEEDIGVKLMKNNEEVLLVWEWQDKGDNEDYASNSVLLKLEVGDKVYMRLPKGYQVAASKNSNIHTFSGFLLYPFHDSEDQSREVAFTAALQPSSWDDSGFGRIGPFDSEITLVHGKALTNVGGAYDSNIGVFTAPVKGVYFFTFTTYSWVAEADIGVKLMKNNEEVLLVWEWQDKGDNEDYASNSVLLELEVGDRVYMRLPKGYQVAASIKSNIHTFSGFLLYSTPTSTPQ